MEKNIEILANREELIDRALEILLAKIAEALENRDQFTIALAGGSTPKPLYEALSRQLLPWDKIHVFWGDERYVAPDHPDSNQKMAAQAWLDRVNLPATNIHPMPTLANNPIADAEQYNRELVQFFALNAGEFPAFDVVLLGMGDDAHTASLFPHTEALTVEDRLITVGNKDGQPRITFTVPLINHARCVLFMVTGSNKQAPLAQVFAAQGDAMTYPSRLIQPLGKLWWLLDREAGAKLA
ncbi:MAG: 6-phosphogluconolactonase [Oscillatoriales cyanobacterium CG2_30_40_61]|nr:MAG: 6-phosphogluconolactonase [Oscillatoriales cyanobacterium CG2_30_40_61]